jgi:uncharacterized protein (TIGR03067 family)
MRPFCFLLLAFCTPGLTVGQGAKGPGLPAQPKKDPVAQDLKALEGTWLVISHEINGQKASDTDFRTFEKIVVSGGKMHFADDIVLPFTIDPTKSPKAIDLDLPGVMMAGAHLKGIYSLEKDELKLCHSQSPVGKRPKQFSSDKLELFVLKRKK